MSTRFYYGQKDYIVQLNLMDDIATSSATSAAASAAAAASTLANVVHTDTNTQGLTTTQQANARTNISAAPTASPSFTGAPSLRNGAGVAAYMEMAGNNNVVGAAGMLYGQDQTSVGYLWNRANAPVVIGTNGTERVRIDASGNMGIGGTPTTKLDLIMTADSGLRLRNGSSNTTALLYTQSYGALLRGAKDDGTGQIVFETGSGTESMRIDSSSNLLVGETSGGSHVIAKNVTANNGSPILQVYKAGTGVPAAVFYAVGGYAANSANSAIKVGNDGVTSRSISAGGTINAGGADYAEYMTKADDCGIIAKGQIVGVTAEGKLTDKWAFAVSFLIKSTDPSYVGGDVWGSEAALGQPRPQEPVFITPERENLSEDATQEEIEAAQAAYDALVESARNEFDTMTMPAYEAALAEFNAALEAARQKVDRIAYCGQVPVNVTGATPGQYVIPVQDGDGIKGILVDEDDITFAQYRKSVGVVQNILPDGRANVRVKPV